MLCFTHFQVMPEFIDFFFPFGFQSYAQDFYFSGFRQRTQLAEHWRNATPNARPVDKRLQICYNLKSVEPSDSHSWSIRHCAVYHSFAIKEVRTSWIIVKGDELMKRRIESATSDRGPHEPSDFKSMSGAFKTSLETHLIFCDWSAENWRWYINFLEDTFQSMTRGAFSAPVYVPLLPAAADQLTLQPRTNTQFSMFSRTPTHMTENGSLKLAMKHRLPAPRTYENPETGISQPLPPDEDDDGDDGDNDEPESPLKTSDVKVEEENRDFSFGKLRKVHKFAEKAHEAVLVLKQNILVLAQLKQYYRSISGRQDFPKDLAESCKDAIDDFELRIDGLENDMQTQILRLETLLRLLEDRKTLVKQMMPPKQSAKLRKDQLRTILDYQNTQANKYSTKSMFTMTEDMNDIARKTKIETVSMKVITLVTLFFLPGTFISVGHAFLSVSLILYSTTVTRPFCLHHCPVQIKMQLELTANFSLLRPSWAPISSNQTIQGARSPIPTPILILYKYISPWAYLLPSSLSSFGLASISGRCVMRSKRRGTTKLLVGRSDIPTLYSLIICAYAEKL